MRYEDLDPGMSGGRGRFRALRMLGGVLGLVAIVAVGLGLVGGDDTEPEATPIVAAPEPAAPTPVASVETPTPQGAAAAFVVALNAPAHIDSAARWEWLTVAATPEAAGQIEAVYASATVQPAVAPIFTDLADGEVPGFVNAAPLGYRLVSVTPDAAEVDVWAGHLLSIAGHEPRVWWTTTRLFLEWDGGRWLVAAMELLPGPSPVEDPPDLFVPSAEGFTPFELS